MGNKLKQLLILTALLLSSQCFALPEDREEPIHISADKARIDENTGVTHYWGDVAIRQGTMQINADQVELYRTADGLDRIIAIGQGKDAHFRQKPAQDQPWTDAYGSRMDYQVRKQSLTITGNGRVHQGKDRFSGERIIYDIEHSIVNAFGGKEGKGRVQMVIQPKAKKTQ